MRLRPLAQLVGLTLLLALATASSASGLGLEEVGSFDKPVYVTSDPSDAERLFVVEREGAIELVDHGALQPYVNLTASVSCCDGERGMASIAFAPDYASSRRLYVAYTAVDGAEQDEGDIVVEELTEPANLTDPFAFRRVLTVTHSEYTFHNGGQLQFGPDGHLYLSTGDGGPFDPYEASQDPESGLGKILRLDPDPSPPLGYTPPADNPFAGGAGFAPLIWARGLRNPFRFSFDRMNGDLTIGDVGENSREEIDWAPSPAPGAAGGRAANFGWSCLEGGLPGLGSGGPSCAGTDATAFDPPVFEYDHVTAGVNGAICSGSVIGGYVVRDPDPALGDLYGRYLYADFCTGQIRSLRLPTTSGGRADDDCSTGLRLPSNRPVSFGEDADGRIYIASLAGGVFRLRGPTFEGCPPVEPSPGGVEAPLTASQPRSRTAPRLRIRGAAIAGRPGSALISVFVAPCEGQERRRVLLRRGGSPNGSKLFGPDCRATFARRIRRRSTFRARLVPLPGESEVRSRALALAARPERSR